MARGPSRSGAIIVRSLAQSRSGFGAGRPPTKAKKTAIPHDSLYESADAFPVCGSGGRRGREGAGPALVMPGAGAPADSDPAPGPDTAVSRRPCDRRRPPDRGASPIFRTSRAIPEVRGCPSRFRRSGRPRDGCGAAGRSAERTRSPPPSGPEARRRAKPISRAERSQFPAPSEPISRAERSQSRAERTQPSAPNEPGRPPPVRPRAAPCGTGGAGGSTGRAASPHPGAERTRASASRSPPCGAVRLPTRGREARRRIGRRPDCQRTSYIIVSRGRRVLRIRDRGAGRRAGGAARG